MKFNNLNQISTKDNRRRRRRRRRSSHIKRGGRNKDV
jgi:hypothetical protein